MGFYKRQTIINSKMALVLFELFPNGRTAVVFDSSGSMTTQIQLSNKNRGSDSAIGKAALIFLKA